MIFRYIPPYDLALVPTANGVCFALTDTREEYVKEVIRNKLNLWFKEWFLDQREGVPYRELFYVRNPDQDRIRRVLESVVLSVSYVERIVSFVPNYDAQTRTLAPVMRALLTDGTPVDIDARADSSFILGAV